MPDTAALAPDAILASTNLTGAVAAIQDDPDSPDANWLAATSATAATDLRVSFPMPGLGGVFSPLDLPGLVAWYAADGTGSLRGSPSGATFTGDLQEGYDQLTGSGDTAVFVTQLDDLSGNGQHLTQASTGNQPFLVHDGTRLVVRHLGDVGTRHELVNAAFADFGDVYTTVCGVRLPAGSPANQCMFEVTNNIELNRGFSLFSDTSLGSGWRGIGSGNGLHTVADGDLRDGAWRVASGHCTGSEVEFWLNQTSQGTASYTAPNGNTLSTLTVGSFFDGAFGYHLNGDFAALIICDQQLSQTDREAAEQYVDDRHLLGLF